MATKKNTSANAKKYEQQWDVPSDSDPSAYYTVSLTREGEYVCHCWPFLRDRTKPCKHIRKVEAGEATPRGQSVTATQAAARALSQPDHDAREPHIVVCNVRAVTPVSNADGTEVIELKTPRVNGGNDHVLMTILFDLTQHGVAWETLRQRYHLPRDLTFTWVQEYAHEYGRLIYGPWKDGVGFDGFTYVPPEDAR
jgi:hypothetical protein